ncbi:MAG: hypothetical protein OSB06_07975 [SAR324 cluster bacterium]|nr:hypothetical protein [SAR324 cluster bacterium]
MNEELYLVAYKDIEQKEIDEALWLKAMSHAGGDKTKAKWAYIELRVDQLLRDPSLRHSASKKVRKPTHQSGAYMMWFSILFFFTIISAAVVVDVEEMTLVFSNGLYVLDVWSLIFVLPASIFFGISATSWTTYLRCWTYTFGSAKRVTIIDARAVARCLNVMGLVSLKMGVIGTLLIVIFMFHDLDNWKVKVTMAVITLVYGVVLKLLAYVLEQRVLNHYVH